MLRSMITASNTMGQLQKQLDMIGHNMANVDTQSFKRTQTAFSELVRQQFQHQLNDQHGQQGITGQIGKSLGTGARLGGSVVYTQGNIKQTERALDLAFTAPNQFLQVDVNGEVQYTRDGALYLSPTTDGSNRLMLTDGEGNLILDENQNPILFEDTFRELIISPDGTITAAPKEEGEMPQIYSLGVIKVNQPQVLEQKGSNRYGIKDDENIQINTVLEYLDGALREEVSLRQGALELSNVDLTKEMTDLMISQRSYQMNAKSITMGDQMLGLINGVR